MSKVRINDLARELEVKSKAILDVLPKVGVTEKKTHSSSLELDEAERVRQYLGNGGSSGAGESRSRAESPGEIKTKVDLSRVSKPGDVAKLIREKMEHAPEVALEPAKAPVAKAPPAKIAQVAARSATTPSSPPAIASKAPVAPVVTKPGTLPAQKMPVTTQATTPKVVTPATGPRPRYEVPADETARKIPHTSDAAVESVVAKAVVEEHGKAAKPGPVAAEEAHREREAEAAMAAQPATPSAPSQSPGPAVSRTPARGHQQAHQQQVQQRRVIVPQTGPRPVYSAPLVDTTAAARQPGGLPVRGQPIYARPRPGGDRPGPGGQHPAGTRSPVGPGGRRMHPVRAGAGPAPGGRPGFGGPRPGGRPGVPTLEPPPAEPGRPQRPGGPNRRPGQRYEPRGIKEGPMKGFVPPPRFGASLPAEPVPITRTITITEGISVKDLAEKLEVRAKDIIARLLVRGVMATVNQTLDAELAKDVAHQFGADSNVITFEEQMTQSVDEGLIVSEADINEVPRPPVVTIMGHVDHGKTSLLDAIRETDVAAGEAGGITQHIGAYKVRIAKEDSPAFGREIVFLDTPGHEAFTRMRARGAKVTDIVVIVVAADDGVMPQTLEAIDHANAAKVPLIVAVNKIDKPGALPDRVKKQLGDRGLVPEDWGGNTVFVDVSAKQRTNLNLLLEMICLVADLQNLKASPDRPATGTVLEAKLDRGRGAVATVLVQNGTLKIGDNFIVGNTFGKVRAMFDDRAQALETAGPSTPVELLGLEGIPQAGDTLTVLIDRANAKSIAGYREQKAREAQLAKSSRLSLEGLAEQIKTAGTKELPIILKGDVQGSVEVLADSLQKMSTEKVKIKVLRTGVGAITESDVLLASASNAIIIGFNVRPERKAQELAEQDSVDIRLHSIIYELQDEIRKAMTGLLEPTFKETYLGRAEVRDTFRVPKVGTVAGCSVQDGVIKRDAEVRLIRDNVEIYKGKIGSLKRFKDDASEVRNGMECGIGIAGYGDIKVGDIIEAFTTEKIAGVLV